MGFILRQGLDLDQAAIPDVGLTEVDFDHPVLPLFKILHYPGLFFCTHDDSNFDAVAKQ